MKILFCISREVSRRVEDRNILLIVATEGKFEGGEVNDLLLENEQERFKSSG